MRRGRPVVRGVRGAHLGPARPAARRTRAVVAREALRGARRQAHKRLTHHRLCAWGPLLRVDGAHVGVRDPQIDHIYVCQFDAHDRFFIYALKGRNNRGGMRRKERRCC